MTNEVISGTRYGPTANKRWQPIFADLAFWSVAGAIVAALSGPLGQWWSAPPTALLAGGLAFLVVGSGLWFWLHRIRPTPRGLVWSFGVFNLALAPIVWVAALSHWLPVSGPGTWALASAGGVMLVLGAWQLLSLRRT